MAFPISYRNWSVPRSQQSTTEPILCQDWGKWWDVCPCKTCKDWKFHGSCPKFRKRGKNCWRSWIWRDPQVLLSKDTIRHAFFAITMESMAHLCKIYLSKMVIFHNDVEKTRGYIHLNVVPGAQPLLEKKSEKIEADFPITGTSHKKWDICLSLEMVKQQGKIGDWCHKKWIFDLFFLRKNLCD